MAVEIADYQYSPLEPSHIRLIKFDGIDPKKPSCSIESFLFEETPNFRALSYTWGNPIRSKHATVEEDAPKIESIECNSGKLNATLNLFNACLYIAQSYRDEYFWIDAICINQSDTEEKAEQINLMGQIYRRAQMVLVWLGSPCAELESVIWVTEVFYPKLKAHMEHTGNINIIYRSIIHPRTATLLDIEGSYPLEKLVDLFRFQKSQRWFSRVWTLQEAIRAQELTVQCGSTQIPWEVFQEMAQICASGPWQREVMDSLIMDGESPVGNWFIATKILSLCLDAISGKSVGDDWVSYMAWLFGPDTERTGRISWFILLVLHARGFESTDKRDKIFALTGLVLEFLPLAMRNSLKVDYSASVEEVFIQFSTFVLLNTRTLSLLSFVEDLSFRNMTSLPSWVPDYSSINPPLSLLDSCFSREHDSMVCHGKDRSWDIQDATLNCSGVLFDEIVDVCMGLKEVLEEFRISTILEFACKLPEVLRNGVPRVEALWRTLINNKTTAFLEGEDRYNDSVGQTIENSFYPFLMVRLELQLGEHGDDNEAISKMRTSLQTLDPDGTSKLIPTLNAILEYRARDQEFERTRPNETSDEGYELDHQGAPYAEIISVAGAGRRLFITSKGLLGLGPASTETGDRVWFLRDARVPFVMRDRPGDKSVQLIGECYMHGFMNGEVLDPEWGVGDDFSNISIT